MKAQFSLFTIIPVEITGDDVTHLSRRFWTVPVIGLFYGLVAGTLFYALGHVFNGLIVAAIILLAVHGLNRFLHFDGLIDLGDGLIATGTMEKKMSAMKDTRVGAGGVAFASLFILLIASSLASVPEWLYIVPIAMEVLAKNSLFTVAAFGRPREGLGNPFVSNAAPS
ncbi:MAG TPA: adenosylcobinamide-GDP ribazoletransferase, partial [Methanomassiliicoccaceae archaeon]|nr:adenosylcobinamide-GDP ribazoletransferase [Methanomassiliicoccaceae archaeon]